LDLTTGRDARISGLAIFVPLSIRLCRTSAGVVLGPRLDHQG
jgi:hypothetical protein